MIFRGTDKKTLCNVFRKFISGLPTLDFDGEKVKLGFAYGITKVNPEDTFQDVNARVDEQMYKRKLVSKSLKLLESWDQNR